LTQGQFTLVSVDSQELVAESAPGTKAIDGNVNTIWHTVYSPSAAALPHTIILDLGASYQVDGFKYLPRQDSNPNGTIAGYQFYVSTDGVTWGSAVASGTFTADLLAKTIRFTAKLGRYVKLVATSEINGQQWTSVAELNVFGTSGALGSPLSYIVQPPVSAEDCWNVTSIASDGSESAATASFSIPMTILGGGIPHHIVGGD
jgi:hypothetical protein